MGEEVYNIHMPSLELIIKTSTVTLLALEIASVANRSRAFHKKREPWLFLAVLALLCLKTLLPDLEYFREFSVFVLLFAAKLYLAGIVPFRLERIYDFSFFGIVLISLV